MRNKLNIRQYIIPCITLSAVAVGVQAQDSPNLIEEIIVTAERREQSLQEVPLSITAFGDEKRDIVGILTIQDMADFSPGVSYNTSLDRPTIRGVGRQSNTFSLDSPVANYYDGVYTTSVQDAQRRPIFIERTEILRGPQGALSGRGSIAGAINTISKRPTEEFDLEVRSYGASYATYGVEGTVSGAFTDWMRGRLNLGSYHQDEGYFENVATDTTEGDQPNNRQIADYLLEVDLGEHVDLFVKAAFAEYDETRRTFSSTSPYTAVVQNSPTPYPSSGLVPTANWGFFDPTATQVGTQTENPVLTTGDRRRYNTDFPSRQKLDDHHNYTVDLAWHTDIVDVKWIGAHQNYIYKQQTDADGTPILTMTLPGGRVVSPGGINTYREEREWYSNEINIASTYESSLQWILGIYQSTEKFNQQPQSLYYPGYPELSTPGGGAPVNSEAFRAQFGSLDGQTTSTAAFGQLDFRLNDMLKFSAGVRYNEDEKEVTEEARFVWNNASFAAGAGSAFDITNTVVGTPSTDPADWPTGVKFDYGNDPVTGNRVRDLEGSWDAVTGSVGVDFTPLDDHLFYFRAAKGYRPGGFDSGFIAESPQVDEESLNAYELGWKGTLFDRLQLSTSVYLYDYKDIQLPFSILSRCTDTVNTPPDPSSCSVVNTFINLPSAENKGLEIEANWAATDNLSFLLAYGYLDARIKDGLVGNGFLNPADPAAILPSANRVALITGEDTGFTFLPRFTQDVSGNSLANSPKNRIALNGNYTFDLAAGNLVLSASYVWRDSAFNDLFETELGETPSYNTVGIRAILTDVDNKYTVIVYGANIFDEEGSDGSVLTRQRTGNATAGSPGANGQAYYRGDNLIFPRQFGVELQYRFN